MLHYLLFDLRKKNDIKILASLNNKITFVFANWMDTWLDFE